MTDLQETLHRLRQVTEQSPAVYELYDSDGLQIEVNHAYERLWGFERERTVGTFNVLESQEVVDTGLIEFVKRAYAGESLQLPPYRFDPTGATEARGEGRVRWLSTRLYPLKDQSGAVTNIVIMHEDVTDAQEAQRGLEESEARFRDIFDNSLDCICILDADKKYVEVNKAAETLTGYSREELLQMGVADMVHPDDQQHSREKFEELDRSGFYSTYQGRILTKTGQTRYIEVNSSAIVQDGVTVGSRDIIRDVTARQMAEEARRALEQQLFAAQKMESVGQLAGGIAHDFNNILAGVMGYSELLRETFPDEDTIEGEASSVIFSGAERASLLTKQLLGFARRGKYNPVALDINHLIRDVIAMSAKIFEERIRVTFDLAPSLPAVEADKSQIDQVITNLIINARDAMPGGGDLLLQTEFTRLSGEGSEPDIPNSPRGYVRISISDSGSGMGEAVQSRIFEPFFSTKGEGKGTGLGLAMVYGIIRNHGGGIDVSSEPGVGTTFSILLPAAEVAAAEREKEAPAPEGSGVVLVIDDEPGVRRIMSRHLETLGYTVLQASDGVEGVDRYRQHADDVDLVLVDMVMPNMDGEETFHALKGINPDVRVVLISGFSQDNRASSILESGLAGFLQKPFRRAALASAVSEALR